MATSKQGLSFSVALMLMKSGFGMARHGFTKSGMKWIRVNPGDDVVLSHLELYYPPDSTAHFKGRSSPWMPSRCDLMENDWFIAYDPRKQNADAHSLPG